MVLNVSKASLLLAACKVSTPSATNYGLYKMHAVAPAGGLSPQASPSPALAQGNTTSTLSPISVGSLLVCIFPCLLWSWSPKLSTVHRDSCFLTLLGLIFSHALLLS